MDLIKFISPQRVIGSNVKISVELHMGPFKTPRFAWTVPLHSPLVELAIKLRLCQDSLEVLANKIKFRPERCEVHGPDKTDHHLASWLRRQGIGSRARELGVVECYSNKDYEKAVSAIIKELVRVRGVPLNGNGK